MTIDRICRLVGDYPEGGNPTYGLQPVFYYLSREQAKQGHEVHVIARKMPSQSKEEITDGVIIHRVNPPFNIEGFRKVKEIVSGDRNTVVHAHATSGVFMSMAKHLLRTPLVAHVHGTTHSHYLPTAFEFDGVRLKSSPFKIAYYYGREKLFWSSADKVLTVSKVIINDLNDYYSIPRTRIEAVYNGVDTDTFKPLGNKVAKGLEHLADKKMIIYVGHFGIRKGLPYLISAMREVKRHVPEAVLVCIGGVPSWLGGTDYWEILRGSISSNNLEDSVVLMDKIPNKLLPYYYSAASVFVLPSYYESFSKVVAEAMACEKPVVATRKGALEEVIDEGSTGFLVDYGSVSQLANAIVRILGDPSLGSSMGRRGREKVLRNFTWKAVATRIDNVYQELGRK